ncbi:MAG: NYN domain-containing protein [Anaerolineales bacterium]|nr:NYN domain-containing protein [Anaerolineales bacterium]
MPYLIDGHNLIPHIPGLKLQDLDDEKHLTEMLDAFCRKSRKTMTVYFDQGQPGGLPVQKLGNVTVRFVRQGITADEGLFKHLKRLGGAARNWTVVSSDREVIANARSCHARMVSSADFARDLLKTLEGRDGAKTEDVHLNEDEIQGWLDLFGGE